VNPYQTHQPLLLACATRAVATCGDVIELGCGLHSTLQLEAVCHGRSVFRSYETDARWAEMVRGHGARRVFPIASYDDVPVRPYALVFIDNSPVERRRIDLSRFVNSRMVVIHDSEYEHYELEPSFALYAHRYDYKRFRPNTTVVSNDAAAVRAIRDAFAQ
jgi:hypothetical protein